jgi:hypothetical protein
MGGWNLPQSKWANPFKVGKDGDLKEVLSKYQVYLDEKIEKGFLNVEELRGKKLMCWCVPNKCHGEVIAKYL